MTDKPLRRRKAERKAKRDRRRGRRPLRFESLEDRRLLAFNIVDDVLIVEGTDNSDYYEMKATSGGLLEVKENGRAYVFDPNMFQEIVVKGYGGNDRLSMAYSTALAAISKELEFQGGSGIDIFGMGAAGSTETVGTSFRAGEQRESSALEIRIESSHGRETANVRLKDVAEIRDKASQTMIAFGSDDSNDITFEGSGRLAIDGFTEWHFPRTATGEIWGGGGANTWHVSNLKGVANSVFRGAALGLDRFAVEASGAIKVEHNGGAISSATINAEGTTVDVINVGHVDILGAGLSDSIEYQQFGNPPSTIVVEPLGNGATKIHSTDAANLGLLGFETATIDTDFFQDTLKFLGSPLHDVVDVTSGQVVVNGQAYKVKNHEQLVIDTDDGDDVVNVQGDADIPIQLIGGGASNGDRLNYEGKVGDVALVLPGDKNGFDRIEEAGRKPVAFSGFEHVSLAAAPQKNAAVKGSANDDVIDVWPHDSADLKRTVVRREGFDGVYVFDAPQLGVDLLGGKDHTRVHAGSGDNLIDTAMGSTTKVVVDQMMNLALANTVESLTLLGESGDDSLHVQGKGGPELHVHGGPAGEGDNLFAKGNSFTVYSGESSHSGWLGFDDDSLTFERVGGVSLAPVNTADQGASLTVFGTGEENTVSMTNVDFLEDAYLIEVDDHSPILVQQSFTGDSFTQISLHGMEGDDKFSLASSFGGKIKIDGGGPGASDSAVIHHAGNADIAGGKVKLPLNGTEVTLRDTEHLRLVSAEDSKVSYTTGPGANTLTFEPLIEPGVSRLITDDSDIEMTFSGITTGRLELRNEDAQKREDTLEYLAPAHNDNTIRLDGSMIGLLTQFGVAPNLQALGADLVSVHGGLKNDDIRFASTIDWPFAELWGGAGVNVAGFAAVDPIQMTYKTGSVDAIVQNSVGVSLFDVSDIYTQTIDLKLFSRTIHTHDFYATLESIATFHHETRPERIHSSNSSTTTIIGDQESALHVVTEPTSEQIKITPERSRTARIRSSSADWPPSTSTRAKAMTRSRSPLANIPVFIDGGGPIGFGDKLIVNAVSTFYPGPENDEGGFDTPGKAAVSYDHIESASSKEDEDDVLLDFGDSEKHSTTLADDGPRHRIVEDFHLGALVDAESDANLGRDATGDDASDQDDEDGVRFGYVTFGQPAEMTVTASAAGLLDAWGDWNEDGVFSSSEHFNNGVSYSLAAGANTLKFFNAADKRGDYTARFRLRGLNDGPLGPVGVLADGSIPQGEVEDHVFKIDNYDFGDAPDSYGTLLASSGPYHRLDPNGTTFLGFTMDTTDDGQPSPGADGDDTHRNDDEEGVAIPPKLALGRPAVFQFEIVGPDPGLVRGWIDIDQDGQFDPHGELVVNQTLAPGVHQVPVHVPVSAKPGDTYARFRISPGPEELDPTGVKADGTVPAGEVEDYLVTISEDECPPNDECVDDPPGPGGPGGPGEDTGGASAEAAAGAAPDEPADTAPITVATPQHNAANPYDVNGDGLVTLVDAYVVIDQLNHYLAGLFAAIDAQFEGRLNANYYADVDGDATISEADANRTIDVLREHFARRAESPSAEAEGAPLASPALAKSAGPRARDILRDAGKPEVEPIVLHAGNREPDAYDSYFSSYAEESLLLAEPSPVSLDDLDQLFAELD